MNETLPATELEVVDTLNGNGALEAMARAEIDMAISTAKRYPRTISKVKADMLSFATLDEETAASCCYALPRGGKMIKGPSIRLAEIAISSYGNLRAGSRVITTETKGDMPHVIVQSIVHDLEKNVAITIEKRRRITKKKSKSAVDEDDVNLACNACAAIALRDAVFKVVPLALIKPVYEAARKVAVGEVKSLVERRGKVLDRLRQMGVSDDRILARVEARKADDIDLDKLEILIGLGTSIKEGEATLEEAFPMIDGSQLVKVEDNSNPDLQSGKPPSTPATSAGTGSQSENSASPAGNSSAPGATGKPSPQAELQALITEAGFSFDDLRKWLIASGNVADADSLAGFDEIKEADAIRLLRAKVGLIKQLTAQKGAK